MAGPSQERAMTLITPDKVISTILKHDTKVTSYKIALLRAINDVVLTWLPETSPESFKELLD
jgi:hypothetical protein